MIDINWEHQGITNPQLLNLDINNQVVTSSKIKSDPNITLSNDNNSNNNLNQFGGWLGQILSSGIGASSNNIALNIIKGNAIFDGLEKDVGSSVAGTVSGITGNLIGQGINKIGNNSRLSRGIGQGIATGIGTVGGTILSNLIRNGNIAGKATKLFGTAGKGLKAFSTGVESVDKAGNVTKAAGAINPYALGATVLGTGLQAALGPSHEYDGRYGGITKGMDTAYDLVLSAVGFIPGYGQAISGAMALNKGLSNVFGSTDGMTKTDAILGSAFMPAPVKWVNMWGSKKTLNFDNQSILNILSAYDFMQGGYGNLDKRFDLAREEANKRYGTFSQGARRRADRNIEFANNAWNTILDLADLNEIQNIRSQYMSSINNQRYSLMISGGYNPIYVGKQGMKILNNATNHNMGLRLLSAAALIDNKQMILSAQGGTKVRRPARPLPRKPATREENPELWDEWERRDAERNASKQRVYLLEREAATRRAETNARRALHYSNLATGVAETAQQNALFEPVTQESLQNSNTERLRQELLADKNEYFDKGMDFINAAGMADLGLNVAGPIFQRSFRWAFNKAGLLVKVPVQKTIQLKSGITKSVLDNGKIRLSLPSHTDNKPRQFVLEPARDAGDNKYYVHMRMWDDIENKIPASNVTNEEKQQLFDALYDELPEGAEILFPKSGPGFYGTRGTVVGLQRLAKDPRFTPGTKGTLLYLDKDGKTVRTYEGTSFIKAPEDIRYSLESDYKGKPVILSVPKTMRKADSDVAKMNEYHTANVLEYNQSTGNNVTSIPFRTDYNGRLVKVLPNEEFNTVVRSKNTNAPSGNEYNIGGMYSKNDDTVYLRNTGNPSNNYHEFLHSSHYGETNPEVTQWRILQLIDEDKVSKMTPQQKAYYISVKETPVHLRLQGERMNIEVGDPYPGDEAFDKMLNEYGIGGATYYMKRDTSKAKQLLWKAFNGTLFSGLTAATLYNTNK